MRLNLKQMEGMMMADEKNNKGKSSSKADSAAREQKWQQLHAEVEQRFGVFPNFFGLTPENPEITAALWEFTQFAYMDNPLPSLFKERLFVYLSRFCEVRYCVTRHAGFLLGLGHAAGDHDAPVQTVEQIIELLGRPLPRVERIEPYVARLSDFESPVAELPRADSSLEEAFFACATHLFLQTADAPKCRDALQNALDQSRFEYLITLLAFVRTAHYWSEVQSDLELEEDIKQLLNTQEVLADSLMNNSEAVTWGACPVLMDELMSMYKSTESNNKLSEIEPILNEIEPSGLHRPFSEMAGQIAALPKRYDEMRNSRRAMLNVLEDTVQSKEKLRESEQHYRNLFESMDQGYCVIEMLFDKDDEPVDYRFLQVNPAFYNLTGLKNVEGKSIQELAPHYEKRWFEVYGNVAKTGEPIRFEQDSKTVPKPSIYSLYAFRIGRPEERKVAVLFDDITQQKKSNRKKTLLAAVVNHSDDAIISKNLDTIILTWNKAAERLFGYTAEEAIGKSITMIIPEERIEEEDMILGKIGRGEVVDHFETVRRRKDGSFVDVSLTISPIRNEKGEIVGASKIARDITEQKRHEEELKALNESLEARVKKRTSALLAYQKQLRSLVVQLSKAEENERRRLATNLHDDLGQILAACKMEMDIIQKTGNLSNMERISGLLDEAVSHTRKLMSDLKPPPQLGTENIGSTLHWIAMKMKRYGLNVDLNIHETQEKLDEDSQIVLSQCTEELLFNVVKHANANEARVEVFYPDNNIKITVEDHGDGFKTGSKELDLSKDGGFGLFNIRERIDMLGGRTEITSKPGTGTKINLIIPLVKENADMSIKEKSKRENWQDDGSQEKIKILLVDDHEMVREGLKQIIESEGDMKVVADASDGNNIVKLVRNAGPDVVIMDINLPGVNGITATRRIKSELPDIQVVGISFHDDEQVARNMRKAGAAAYLTKTEASEALCATIRSVSKAG